MSTPSNKILEEYQQGRRTLPEKPTLEVVRGGKFVSRKTGTYTDAAGTKKSVKKGDVLEDDAPVGFRAINPKYETGAMGGMFLGAQLGAEMGKGEDPMFRLGAVLGGAIAGLFKKDFGEKAKYEKDVEDWRQDIKTNAEGKINQGNLQMANLALKVEQEQKRGQIYDLQIGNLREKNIRDDFAFAVTQIQKDYYSGYISEDEFKSKTAPKLKAIISEYSKTFGYHDDDNLDKLTPEQLLKKAVGMNTVKIHTMDGFYIHTNGLQQQSILTSDDGTVLRTSEYQEKARERGLKELDGVLKAPPTKEEISAADTEAWEYIRTIQGATVKKKEGLQLTAFGFARYKDVYKASIMRQRGLNNEKLEIITGFDVDGNPETIETTPGQFFGTSRRTTARQQPQTQTQTENAAGGTATFNDATGGIPTPAGNEKKLNKLPVPVVAAPKTKNFFEGTPGQLKLKTGLKSSQKAESWQGLSNFYSINYANLVDYDMSPFVDIYEKVSGLKGEKRFTPTIYGTQLVFTHTRKVDATGNKFALYYEFNPFDEESGDYKNSPDYKNLAIATDQASLAARNTFQNSVDNLIRSKRAGEETLQITRTDGSIYTIMASVDKKGEVNFYLYFVRDLDQQLD